jgi:acyl carrier protein
VDAVALRDNRVASADDTKRSAELVGCGQSIAGGELRIVDAQTCQPCPPDRVGEIWLRSPSVARGYWQQPDATAETFAARLAGETDPAAPGWLRTGDLGFVAGGHLVVAGRLKDLVIIRGRNHYPQDLEHTAGSCHSALRPGGGAAFGVEIGDGAGSAHERLIVVHEVERTQRDADPTTIFAAVCESIATAHEVQPQAIVLLKPGRLPRTSSGKVRRHACREAFLANEDLGEIARWTAPATDSAAEDDADTADQHSDIPKNVGASSSTAAEEYETWLLGKLAAALGMPVSEIDPAEPFARYGLDSASAVSLAGEIGAELNLDLEATLFWDHPTVRALAGFLAAPEAAPDAPADPSAHKAA